MNDLNIPTIEKLDMVLDTLTSEVMELDDEGEYKEVNIPAEAIKKLTDIIRKNSLKKITPTPIP